MTEDELQKIEERTNATTLGPWRYVLTEFPGIPDGIPQVHHDTGNEWRGDEVYDLLEGCNIPTAQFIAASRTDIPNLIAEVRRLRAAHLAVVDVSAEGKEYWEAFDDRGDISLKAISGTWKSK